LGRWNRRGKDGSKVLWVSLTVIMLLCSQESNAQTGPVTIDYGRSWPRSIVIDSARGVAYIDGMAGTYPPTGYSFGIINTSSHTVERVFGLNVTAGEVTLDPATGNVYVAGADSIEVFQQSTHNFTRVMEVGVPIRYILFDNVSRNLFVTANGAVYEFDPASGKVLRNATVGVAAEGMAIDESTGDLYVADYLSCAVVVLKAASLSLVASVHLPTPCYPSQMALDKQTGSLYVTSDLNSVDVIGTADNKFERSITVAASSSNSTFAIALDERSGNVFVLTEPGTTVTQLDGSNGQVVGWFHLTSIAYEITVDQATGELYVSVYHDVEVFRPLQNQPSVLLPLVVAVVVSPVVVLALTFVLLRRRPRRPDEATNGAAG
jgi:DNA-binding beta-propeller fold protein YncE